VIKQATDNVAKQLGFGSRPVMTVSA